MEVKISNKDINLSIGLDIGSVSAKCVVYNAKAQLKTTGSFWYKREKLKTGQLYYSPILKVKGEPIKVVHLLLKQLFTQFPDITSAKINITGAQAKPVSEKLKIPLLNEFKAIARGTVELEPLARTILEIGGDASRYIKVRYDETCNELSILDYERNGECAAGTGSFIDHQAERLNYNIDEIGPLVLESKNAANIAGRCSVFAKSDMIHAQQRGYSPGAIFKGLCEAVVRNYKGTVIRGKEIEQKAVLVGGVAANAGVVQAVRSIFDLASDELTVPSHFNYVAAIGCACTESETIIEKSFLEKLSSSQVVPSLDACSPIINTEFVRFEIDNSYGENSFKDPFEAFLGLDIGSVSTNLALITPDGTVIDQIYTKTDGRPIQVVKRELQEWSLKWGHANILGVGTTGSGRELIGELVGADAVHDEITAHKTGATFIAQKLFDENVDTIFEIGGQDSKYISIEDNIVVDFTMNEACAAGTGSFLEEQANKLGISIIDQFASLALSSQNPLKLGERCTVFMEKDVTAFIQQNKKVEDIAAGLAYAVVTNYLNRVVRGRKIGNTIYFQGGTAYNKAVAGAFATVLNKKIIVPPHNGVIGAIGAALLAKEKMEKFNRPSNFYGFDLSQINIQIRQFMCKGCTNHCEIQECTVNNSKTYWGDKCSERYRKKRKIAQQSMIPDLFTLYTKMLHEDIPGPDGLGIKIGIPKTMYFYDRFPFWRTYFAYLGTQVVLSNDTNKNLVSLGRELCIAEPCFPIVIGHGHVVDLLRKEVDFVFLPITLNNETEFPRTESWFCPWGQTLALVINNSLMQQKDRERLLMPVIRFRDGMAAVKKAILPVALKLGVNKKKSDLAVDFAYKVFENFRSKITILGQNTLEQLQKNNQQAVILLGRPYNLFDPGANLNIPKKLNDYYGVNVVPMNFLPLKNIKIDHFHENMFWNYGRQILQAATFVGQSHHLHIIYFTNFKCGPDSYIKHFVQQAVGSPYLTLQFDDHSNDAGIITRCEAYLQSKGLLKDKIVFSEKKEMTS